MSNAHLKPRESTIGTGDTIPDFSLHTQDRTEWKLSDAVKKGDVVLCLFPFAFTGVCGTEMKCISADMQDWKQKGAQVVGLTCDSPFALKAWGGAEGFSHTLLSDQHRQVTRALGTLWADMNTTNRGTIVIPKNADGVARASFVEMRQPGNAMAWDKVLAMIA